MKYLLETTLTINHNDSNSQKSCYTTLYTLNQLREVGQNATIYDKELKMYFEDRSAQATVYEVEIENVYLDLDKSITKASDFIRRTFYRYDWMQLRINRQGKMLAVENNTDTVKQWDEIRALLIEDYDGKQAEDFVKNIDAQMATSDFSIKPLAQYFYFGLLFPAIPSKHNNQWQRSRMIALSDFEEIQFDEHLIYERTTDSNLREYSITGELVEGNNYELNKLYGHIIVPCDDIHPTEAEVDVAYTNEDIDINWNFKLMQL